MDVAFEQQVRERAYGLWIESGQVHGMAHEHWCSAEAAMRHEHAGVAPSLHVARGNEVATVATAARGKAEPASSNSSAKARLKTSAGKSKMTKAAEPSIAKSSAAKSPTPKSSVAKASAAKPAVAKTASKVMLTNAKPTASQMVN